MLTIDDLLKQAKQSDDAPTDDAGSTGVQPPKKDEESDEPVSQEDEATELRKKMKEIEIKRVEKEVEKKANDLGLPYIDLSTIPIMQDAIGFIPEEIARELNVICYLNAGQEIRIGAIELNDDVAGYARQLEDTKNITVKTSMISKASFERGLEIYKHVSKVEKTDGGVRVTQEEYDEYTDKLQTFQDVDTALQKATITNIVNIMLVSSLNMRSSDIHIEAEEEGIKLRFRIDGILQDVAFLPKEMWRLIISRVKLLSGLKLNINTEPQDGRFTVFLPDDPVDLRVSTLPTTWGESVVMRILKSSAASLPFEKLGLIGKAEKDLDEQITRPNGMIITTGPTGSGKTTTLYAILNHLNDSETKIITLEDPVEFKLKGINQSQIEQPKSGLDPTAAKERYTFAKGLKAILRQDPDVVMVGEIRDLETAEVAINAALTGHMMISTLHTNSAAGAIPRFLAMGVQPFMLAPALNAVIGQRLVRRICEACKEEDTTITPEQMARIKQYLHDIPKTSGMRVENTNDLKFYKSKGCPACNGLGYKGRLGVYEVLTMSKKIEDIILSGQVSEYTMQDIAVSEGMVTMVQDGVLKALQGMTTIEEVFSVAE